MVAPTSPKPPDRLPSDPQKAIDALHEWAWALFKDYRDVQQVTRRLEAIAELTPLSLTISNPPTQAQVQAIADRVDAIVAAARRVTS